MTQLLLSLVQAASMAMGAAAATVPADDMTATPPAQAAVAESYEQQLVRARELAIAGQRDDAIALYTTMLERSPGNTDVLLGRGRTYAWMGQWPQAEADLLAVTTKAPTYADAWSALGDMYMWSDRPAQAVDAYGHWQALSPTNAQAYIARGRAYRGAGDYAAASAQFDAAGERGADPKVVDDYKATLMQGLRRPDAVVPVGYRWSARLGAGHIDFSPDRDSWDDYVVSLRRHFDRGSVGLELLRADRFGTHDNAWAIDAYAPLWTRAYANLRYQDGPSDGVLPDQAWRVEVFQGVGSGWELSASYDHLEFSGNTDIYGVGIGKYTGNFYLRYRALYVGGGSGSNDLSHRGLVRYYYAGNADDYFEINGGTGSNDPFTDASGRVQSDSHYSVGLAFVKFFSPHWGTKLDAGYGDNIDGFDERAFAASLYARW
jgi:YaiO family outer membrane protein